MNVRKMNLFGLIATLTILAGTLSAPAHARLLDNAVFADTPVLSTCGTHTVAFSGTASYDPGSHLLTVLIDGELVYHTEDEPLSWSFLHEVNVGEHTLTAQVYDNDEIPAAEHEITFEVMPCEESSDTGDDSDSGDGDSSDDENKEDCCPGPNPVTTNPTPASTPRVKGASTTSDSLTDLSPLNSIFRFVYGRTPTYSEWKYWADRYLTDKPAWDQILGAMQWQKLHGRTIGT